MADKTSLTGMVGRELMDAGSKHEHEGYVLRTPSGEKFALRHSDGPSFGDQGLAPLVGQSIETHGFAQGKLFIMKTWRALD